jgi:hypothetical protein
MMLGKIIGIGAVAAALALTLAPAAHASSTVTVPASASGGVSTSVSVLSGDSITITASGSAGYGYEGAAPCAGYPATYPDGSRYLGSTNCGPKDDPNAALSGGAIGLLIARIGGGPWFAVGTSATFTASAYGTLVVAYNDSVYSDNTGSYSVTVTDNGGGVPRCPPDGCIHGCPPSGCLD